VEFYELAGAASNLSEFPVASRGAWHHVTPANAYMNVGGKATLKPRPVSTNDPLDSGLRRNDDSRRGKCWITKPMEIEAVALVVARCCSIPPFLPMACYNGAPFPS